MSHDKFYLQREYVILGLFKKMYFSINSQLKFHIFNYLFQIIVNIETNESLKKNQLTVVDFTYAERDSSLLMRKTVYFYWRTIHLQVFYRIDFVISWIWIPKFTKIVKGIWVTLSFVFLLNSVYLSIIYYYRLVRFQRTKLNLIIWFWFIFQITVLRSDYLVEHNVTCLLSNFSGRNILIEQHDIYVIEYIIANNFSDICVV